MATVTTRRPLDSVDDFTSGSTTAGPYQAPIVLTTAGSMLLKKIVVAEDDDAIANLVSMALGDAGYLESIWGQAKLKGKKYKPIRWASIRP